MVAAGRGSAGRPCGGVQPQEQPRKASRARSKAKGAGTHWPKIRRRPGHPAPPCHHVNRVEPVLHGVELKIHKSNGHVFRRMARNTQLTRLKYPGMKRHLGMAMVKELNEARQARQPKPEPKPKPKPKRTPTPGHPARAQPLRLPGVKPSGKGGFGRSDPEPATGAEPA